MISWEAAYAHALHCGSCGAAGDKRFRDIAVSGPARWQSNDGGMLRPDTLGATCCMSCGVSGLQMRPVAAITAELIRQVRALAAAADEPVEAGANPRTGARFAGRVPGDPLRTRVIALQRLLQAEAGVRYIQVSRDGVKIVPPLPF